MAVSFRFRRAAVIATLILGGCQADPLEEENDPKVWRRTPDGFLAASTSNGFRQITRCWGAADGPNHCVWIGGTANARFGADSFTAIPWLAQGRPEAPGIPERQHEDQAYYLCGMTFDGGRLSTINEELAVGATRVMSNERGLYEVHAGRPWTAETLATWSQRTGIRVDSPMLDCQQLGRAIEEGNWEMLQTANWTGPSEFASSELISLDAH